MIPAMKLGFLPVRPIPILVVSLIATLALGVALGRYILPATSPSAKVEAKDSDQDHQEIKLNSKRMAAAGIRTIHVSLGDLSDQIIAQATVAPTPQGAAVIGARADGTVTVIRKRLGDVVRAGESLGAIQSREAAKLAEERDSAKARLARTEQAFERQKNLLRANATSRQEYDAAQAEWQVAQSEWTRAVSSSGASGLSKDGISLEILSPISGRITSAPAVLGSYVVAGTELFRVANPERLEIQAAVPSQDAQRISIGDKATVDLPQGPVAAAVRAITPNVDLESRAATVVLVPTANAPSLQPGQLVSARIFIAHGHTGNASALVPTEALQKIGGTDAVFLKTDDGFKVQTVTVGTESGGTTEIQSGLKPGDEIATRNSFLLKAELQKDSAGGDD
jgi:cobalt-zinc-cadmium efflux system membrane fusion protein